MKIKGYEIFIIFGLFLLLFCIGYILGLQHNL